MTTPDPGWFPDPAGRPDAFRWWDGAGWTGWLTDDPSAPRPATSSGVATSDTATSDAATSVAVIDRGQPAAEPEVQSGAQPTAETRINGLARIPSVPPGYEQLAARRRTRRDRVRSLLGVGVLAAILAVAAVIIVQQRDQYSDFSAAPPAPVPSQTGVPNGLTFDSGSRVLQTDGLQVTMPDQPFELERTEYLLGGVINKGVYGTATVHENYDGRHHDWVALVAAGRVDSSVVKDTDLSAAATTIFHKVLADGYSAGKTKITKLVSEDATGYPHPARTLTAQVHYKVKGVPSSYDKISILVVDTGHGYSTWVAERPNDSGKAVQDAFAKCVQSLTIER